MASKKTTKSNAKEIVEAFKAGTNGGAQRNTSRTKKSQSTKKSQTTIIQDTLVRSGLEIYKTKDKNIEKTSKDKEKEGFVLQNGTITEIAYFDELVSTSFEHDYEDISSNGSVNLVNIDETRFYKGKKIFKKHINQKNGLT